MFLAGGNSSVQTFSSSMGMMGGMGMGMGGGMNMRSSSTSTRIINGRKVTTKKVMDNGVETVTTYENDVLKSQTVNGVAQGVGGPGGSHASPQHRAGRQHHLRQQGFEVLHPGRRRQH